MFGLWIVYSRYLFVTFLFIRPAIYHPPPPPQKFSPLIIFFTLAITPPLPPDNVFTSLLISPAMYHPPPPPNSIIGEEKHGIFKSNDSRGADANRCSVDHPPSVWGNLRSRAWRVAVRA